MYSVSYCSRSYIFVYLLLVFSGGTKSETLDIKDGSTNQSTRYSQFGLAVYQKVLKSKRLEQRRAVLMLSEITNLKKQFNMAEPVMKKILEVLGKSRSAAPENQILSDFDSLSQTEKENMSMVLENILFLGDIVLRLPDSALKVLKKISGGKEIIQWAISYANATGFLEETDLHSLNLMSQELLLLPRSEDYINIYTEDYKRKQENYQKQTERQQQKQKKTKKKTSRSAGEL